MSNQNLPNGKEFKGKKFHPHGQMHPKGKKLATIQAEIDKVEAKVYTGNNVQNVYGRHGGHGIHPFRISASQVANLKKTYENQN